MCLYRSIAGDYLVSKNLVKTQTSNDMNIFSILPSKSNEESFSLESDCCWGFLQNMLPKFKTLICKPLRCCHYKTEVTGIWEDFCIKSCLVPLTLPKAPVHKQLCQLYNPALGEGEGRNKSWDGLSLQNWEIIQRRRAELKCCCRVRRQQPFPAHSPLQSKDWGKILVWGYSAIIHPPKPCHPCHLEHLNLKFHLSADFLLKLQGQMWIVHLSFHWFWVILGEGAALQFQMTIL